MDWDLGSGDSEKWYSGVRPLQRPSTTHHIFVVVRREKGGQVTVTLKQKPEDCKCLC